MIRQLIFAVAMAAGLSGAVAAQAPAASATCPGKAVTIRLSAIKLGQLSAFRKAVADHQAWYATHHNATKVELVHLATRSATGGFGWDDGSAMTIVTHDLSSNPEHDAGYQAFVGEYKASSDVKQEYRGCIQ